MTRVWTVTAAIILGSFTMAVPAHAQAANKHDPNTSHFGVRGGGSGFPDQFVVGAHIDAPEFHYRTFFRPSAEVGFGDGSTLLTGNIDLVHWMPFSGSWSKWAMYAGAGVGANFEMYDNDGGSDFYGNLSAVFGFQHASGLFMELRVGERPSAKAMVGFVFK